MRALTVVPKKAGSLQYVEDLPEPSPAPDEVVVEGRFVGVCGTDREIAGGDYGWAPPGQDHLVIGHESLGVVKAVPDGSQLSVGDLVVGVVRRPDPVPCPPCGAGQFDFCRNGKYTEHGIKELDGFARETWTATEDAIFRLDSSLGDLGVLMEPTSVVAKAWDQVAKIGSRAWWSPRTVLVTGAGPIGLLAAMIGVQRGLDVHVLDRVTEGPKPDLVRDLGATYHASPDDVPEAVDVVLECTGVGKVVLDAVMRTAAPGITCLVGVSTTGRSLQVDVGEVNNELVLENDVLFGSVNANRGHYELAAQALQAGDPSWLGRLVSRKVPLKDFEQAFERRDGDIKVVLDVQS